MVKTTSIQFYTFKYSIGEEFLCKNHVFYFAFKEILIQLQLSCFDLVTVINSKIVIKWFMKFNKTELPGFENELSKYIV